MARLWIGVNPLRVLLFLFFLATISSQSAMDLFASLIVLAVIFHFWKSKSELKVHLGAFKKTPGQWFWFWLAGWFLASTLSLVFNQHSWRAWGALFDFKWTVFLFFLIAALQATRTFGIPSTLSLKKFLPAFAALSLASLYSIAIWYFRFDPLDPANDFSPWSGGVRSGGLLSNPMTFAHVYSLHLCLWLGLLIIGFVDQHRSKWLLLFGCAVTAVAILLSFTRGAWLGLIVAFLMMALVRNRKAGLLAGLGLAAGIFLLLNSWELFSNRAFDLSRNGDERQIIWKAHFQLFQENPFFGVGFKQTSPQVVEIYKTWKAPSHTQIGHAHNQYLHWLASIGIIGCFFATGFFCFMALMNYRSYQKVRTALQRKSLHEAILLGGLGAHCLWFVGALTESSFEHSKVKYVLVLIWALVIKISQAYDQPEVSKV